MSLTPPPELVFIFIGGKLPGYALPALKLAKVHSGLSLRVLARDSLSTDVLKMGIHFTPLSDFYRPDDFSEARKRVSESHTFRSGFWLHTLERLFVLEQFFRHSGAADVVHAELDQLIFGADDMVRSLRATQAKGIFLPFHDEETAVASLIYVNSLEALQSLISFSKSTDTFPNEMVLMARWSKKFPSHVIHLPSGMDICNNLTEASRGGPRRITGERIGGVVDALQLGIWLGGLDPRNIPVSERPTNHLLWGSGSAVLSNSQLEAMTWDFDPPRNQLTVTNGEGVPTRVFSIHLHSKIHPWLARRPKNIPKFFRLASEKVAYQLPGTRQAQLFGLLRGYFDAPFKLERVVAKLERALFRVTKARPTSHPFVSGDGFRKFANQVWQPKWTAFNSARLKPGDVIFCESERLEEVAHRLALEIDFPVILLLGNSDRNFDSVDYFHALPPQIGHVFAQNLNVKHPKASSLPIGIENAWRANHGRRAAFRRRQTSQTARHMRLMWSFTVEHNEEFRGRAASQLSMMTAAENLTGLSPPEHRKALGEYAFVACPPGNGHDTHRLWEAMYLGCVPVVLDSPLMQTYDSLGLPVLVVESYSVFGGFTESKLLEIYRARQPKFDAPPLWNFYWFAEISKQSMRIRKNQGFAERLHPQSPLPKRNTP